MRKKISLIIAAVISLSILTGCGKPQETNSRPAEAQSQEVESTVAPTATPEPTGTPVPTPTEVPHEHAYTESVSKEATCTETGEKTFTCECGETYIENIEATGHNYEVVADSESPATCTTDGKEADTKCSLCDDIKEGAGISKASHKYGEYVYNNDATQEKDGTKSRTCAVCGKVDTKTAEGTKIPFDPYSLRAVTSLDDIFIEGEVTQEDTSILIRVGNNIDAGKYEKIRYIASNGEQFCMWNVRVSMEDTYLGVTNYYWYIAPVEGKFSDGTTAAKFLAFNATNGDSFIIARGMNTSSRENECMLNRDESIPLAYRKINSKECPVTLYEIVETDNMVSVWVEGTNCIQEGIGTCGTIDCTGTCLRQTTMNQLLDLVETKGWFPWISGENGRINWNGKLLVNFFYLPY